MLPVRYRLKPAVPAGLCLLLSSILGCGPSTANVSGTVTVDGQALDKGIITFASAEKSGDNIKTATANIENGAYRITVSPGKNNVQVSAPIVTGQQKQHNGPGAPMMDITKERLPPRYNSSSELTYDVPSGGGTKDWTLETKETKDTKARK